MADRAGNSGAGSGEVDNDGSASERMILREYVILPNNRVRLVWVFPNTGKTLNQRMYFSSVLKSSLKIWGLFDPEQFDVGEGVAMQDDGSWKVTNTASRLGLRPGRRPIGERAMTAAERQRASRLKRKQEAGKE